MRIKHKEFDCVEMKRCIQEKIYEDTKNMNHGEFSNYIKQRIRNSRFASFLERPVSKHTDKTENSEDRDL